MTSSKLQLPIVKIICNHCGIDFWISRNLLAVRRLDGRVICCPSGHQQRFQTGHEDKFSKEENVDNLVLRAQVEFLSKKLKEAGLVLKTTKSSKHPPRIRKARKGV
jgi:hypothetical protein